MSAQPRCKAFGKGCFEVHSHHICKICGDTDADHKSAACPQAAGTAAAPSLRCKAYGRGCVEHHSQHICRRCGDGDANHKSANCAPAGAPAGCAGLWSSHNEDPLPAPEGGCLPLAVQNDLFAIQWSLLHDGLSHHLLSAVAARNIHAPWYVSGALSASHFLSSAGFAPFPTADLDLRFKVPGDAATAATIICAAAADKLPGIRDALNSAHIRVLIGADGVIRRKTDPNGHRISLDLAWQPPGAASAVQFVWKFCDVSHNWVCDNATIVPGAATWASPAGVPYWSVEDVRSNLKTTWQPHKERRRLLRLAYFESCLR
jgi:hypothetical protein